MGQYETELLGAIVRETSSELVLFAIVIVVALVVVMLPIYIMMTKERKHKYDRENIRQQQYIDREKEIIRVITANTEVSAGLKATLDNIGNNINNGIIRIHDRIDVLGGDISLMKGLLINVSKEVNQNE